MTVRLRQFVKKRRKLLQAFLGALLLAVVIQRSQPELLLKHISSAPLALMVPWLAFYYLLTVFLWGCGIHFLLRRINSKRGSKGWRQLIWASFKLQVISVLVPGRLGDLGLMYFLRDRYTPGQGAAVLLVDKIITLVVNLSLAVCGLGVIFSWRAAVLFALAAVAGFAALLWFFLKCPRELFRWRVFESLLARLDGFRYELRETLTDYRAIAANLLLTCFRYFLAGLSMVLLLQWFGVSMPLPLVVLIQSLAQFVTFIPLTAMGIGVQEATNVYLLGLYGATPSVVLAISLWGRAVHLAFVFMAYGIWSARMDEGSV